MDRSSHKTKVRALAQAFRAAIEESDPASMPISFRWFPRGACGHASDLLGQFLGEHGFGAFTLVSGWMATDDGSQPHSHAWLEGYGLVVDITADQFEGVSEAVIVVSKSAWHTQFQDLERRRPGISEYAIAAELWRAYRAICSRIALRTPGYGASADEASGP